MKQFVAPRSTFRVYPEGEHCVDAEPGDIVLVHHTGFLPAAIRTGQRLFYWRKRLTGNKDFAKHFCDYNHACVVVEGGENAAVVEMEARGGTRTDLATYSAKKYAVVKIVACSSQRRAAVNWTFYCVFLAYGWVSIVGSALSCLLPWSISLSTDSPICSTATSLAARCMGLIPDRSDANIFPADLARYFNVH